MPDTAEMDQLWARRKADDRPARDALILRYEPLVRHVAARVAGGLPRSVDEEDLVSYGVFGLLDAIEKFEPERGFKFETYATNRIKGAILDGLRASDWVPRSVRAKARAVEQAHVQLETELHREPTDSEMADAMDLTIEQFHLTIGQVSLAGTVPLDEMLPGGDRSESVTLGDTIADTRMEQITFEVEDLRRALTEVVAEMTERDVMVLALYYHAGLTLAEIGQALGVTESRVCQIHTKAIQQFHLRLTE
jgi:RNA polymerase sigma factor for flagellar operon FliA